VIAFAREHFFAQIRKEMSKRGRANKQCGLQHRSQFGPFLFYRA
jgi:hypothetical protein